MERKFLTRGLIGTMVVVIASTAPAAPITGGTGPGGIARVDVTGSSLRLWLDGSAGTLNASSTAATNGQAIATWTDQSFYGNTPTQSTAGSRPTLTTGAINGMSAVTFDGADDFFLRTSPLWTSVSQGSTVFAVTSWSTIPVTGTQRFFSMTDAGDTTTNAIFPQVTVRAVVTDANAVEATRDTTPTNISANATITNPYTVNTPAITTGEFNRTPNTAEVSVNGTVFTTNTAPAPSMQVKITPQFSIGALATSTNSQQYTNGKIAEVIAYDSALTFAQKTSVDNYLSAKYGIAALTNDERYAGDDASNGNYDFGVFGVLRTTVDSLTNAGYQGIGIEATGSLDIGDAAFAGHKVVSNSIVAAGTGYGGQRWNRVWYIDFNGTIDGTFAFDFSDAGLSYTGASSFQLLYSSSQTFSWTQKGFGTITGDTVTFNLSGLGGGTLPDGYYTLGFIVPEPGIVGLMSLSVLLFRRRGTRA